MSDSYGNKDYGILLGAGAPPGVGDANTVCIHQPDGTGNNIINDTSHPMGIWLCYTWFPAGNANQYQIYWCTSNYTPAASASAPSYYRGAAACTAASTNWTFLGSAFSWAPSFTQSASSGNSQLQFSLTLNNCLNDAAATCNAGGAGVSSDPVNNPEVQLTGSVAPPQVGTG